jgi:hypothetical protein
MRACGEVFPREAFRDEGRKREEKRLRIPGMIGFVAAAALMLLPLSWLISVFFRR